MARRGAGTAPPRYGLAVELKEDGVQVGQPAGRLNPILTPTSLNERDQFAPGIWFGVGAASELPIAMGNMATVSAAAMGRGEKRCVAGRTK